MWATAHIRESFFAGLRTTSCCEALHSHMGQFLHARINMTDFVGQFHRCLTYFQFKKIEADFQSNYGQPVIQTSLRLIEKSAVKQVTKEIFCLFRLLLKKSQLLCSTESQEMSTGYIFNILKYCGDGSVWYVTYCEEPIDFKCCCLWMESIGLPCDHIFAVMLYLDFDELPNCLVLQRWSKFAKDSIREKYGSGSLYWDSQPVARYSGIVQMSKVVVELVCDDLEEYNHVVDILAVETSRLKHKRYGVSVESSDVFHTSIGEEVAILNPDIVRTKGCGAFPNGTPSKQRGPRSCGICGVVGHNKRSCPHKNMNNESGQIQSPVTTNEGTNYSDDDCDLEN